MSSVLTPSSADMSVKLLDRVIGPGWQNLFTHGVQGGHLTLLGHMFATWNTLILSGLVVLFSVVATSGIISAAHEGKQTHFHGAWVPIRAVGSIGLLTPLPWAKGFCLLQALVLMFTSYGIGLADHLWGPAAQYMAEQGSTLTAPSVPGVWKTADSILRAQIERAYYIHRKVLTGQALNNAKSGATFTFTPGQQGYLFGLVDHHRGRYISEFPASGASFSNFGTITVTCEGPVQDPLCDTKARALAQVVNGLYPVAEDIVSQHPGGRNIPTPPPSLVRSLIAQYTAAVQAAVPSYIQQGHAALASNLHQFAQQAQSEGWASAGMWYEAMARANNTIAAAVSTAPTATAAPFAKIAHDVSSSRLPGYLAAGEALMRKASPSMQVGYDESLSSGGNGKQSELSKKLNWLPNKLSSLVGLRRLENAMTGPDPLSAMQTIGNEMVVGAIAVFGAAAVASFFGGSIVMMLALPLVVMLLAGFEFGYYLPFLPFTLWAIAMLGWVVLVLESLVAAPLWAAAHGMPEGEGFAGTSGRQGYMLFLSVMVRPALMIFGFVLATGVFDVMTWWVGEGIKVFAGGAQAHEYSGPIATYAITALLGGLVLVIAHQSFGLITWLPTNVTNWIGQFGRNLGEQGSAAEVRGSMSGAIGYAKGGVSGAGAGIGKKADQYRADQTKQQTPKPSDRPSSEAEKEQSSAN